MVPLKGIIEGLLRKRDFSVLCAVFGFDIHFVVTLGTNGGKKHIPVKEINYRQGVGL